MQSLRYRISNTNLPQNTLSSGPGVHLASEVPLSMDITCTAVSQQQSVSEHFLILKKAKAILTEIS